MYELHQSYIVNTLGNSDNVQAIHTHGSVKGTTMGVARILRCHPFVKGGIDYVPLKFRLTKNPDKTYHGPYTYRRNKKTEVEKDG